MQGIVRKLLKITLMMAMVIGLLPGMGLSVTAEPITWNIGPTGLEAKVTAVYDAATKVLTISGTGPMKDFSTEPLPWNSYRSDIQSVVIANGVTTIGNKAFETCAITSVDISGSVTSIGNYAFYNCTHLGTVTFAPGAEKETISFGAYPFMSEGTQSVNPSLAYGEGTTKLYDGNGNQITAGYNLRDISNKPLTWKTEPGTIGNPWLIGPNGNNTVTAYLTGEDNNKTLHIQGEGPMNNFGSEQENWAPWFQNYSSKIKSIEMAEGVTTIGNYAFDGCAITSITIP